MPNRLHHFFRAQLLCLAALVCLIPGLAAADPDTLYFAPLPMEQPEEVVKQFKPMLNFLERQLGVRIEIAYSTSYAEILERFRTGQIDLAYLGPLPYVSLRENFPQAEPLVHFREQNGQASYSCALFASDQRLTKPLRNKTFALTQALSTCGYLAVDGLLSQQGARLAQQRYRYLGKHDEAILAVARGDFDFGGAKTDIVRNYTHLGISILAETPPLPAFAMVANSRRLSPERQSRLRSVLAELEPKGRDQALMRDWGKQLRNGAIAAADADYDVVRRLRRQTSIPEQGNF
jgi:phosphonate transport system substrate-binding protein